MKNNTFETFFDVIVIGNGLCGSAAAKYLAKSGLKTAVIGPDEPVNYETASVFSSHYDQARVQRIIGFDPLWTKLCLESVAAYVEMESKTGIKFTDPTGCLYIAPEKDKYLESVPAQAEKFGLTYLTHPVPDSISANWPQFKFEKESVGIYEKSPAGAVFPRELIKAQNLLFGQAGGEIIKDVVTRLSFEKYKFTLFTESDAIFKADRVLLAAGAFTNFMDILPKPIDIKVKGETVILAEVTKEFADKLALMPTLLYEITTPEYDGIYMIRPLQYPDGKYYIKMGLNLAEDVYCNTLEEAQNWFRNGNSQEHKQKIFKILKDLVPELETENYFTKRCIITRTPNKKPFIDGTEFPGLFVLMGCNGYSAMCSDAQGRVAASLVSNGNYPAGYSTSNFKAIWK